MQRLPPSIRSDTCLATPHRRLEDEYLLLDEGSLLVEGPPALPRPAPREAQPQGGLLSTKQLGALTAAFLSAAPSGFLRLQDAADMLCRWVTCSSAAHKCIRPGPLNIVTDLGLDLPPRTWVTHN